MSDKEKDLGPLSIEEVEHLFFGEDDSKPVNLGKGRPKKEDQPKKNSSFSELLNSLPEEDEEESVDEEMYPSVEINDEEKEEKNLTEKEKDPIRRQVKFLKKYEERKQKLQQLQQQVDLEKSVKNELKRKIREEKQKKDETKIKNASYLVKFKDPTGCLYGNGGKIYVAECKTHMDVFDMVQGLRVLTRCTKCSRLKEWDPKEWEFYQQNKYKNC